jgi:hypothetical protein
MSSFCSRHPYFCYHLPLQSPLHQFKPICGKRDVLKQGNVERRAAYLGQDVDIIQRSGIDSWLVHNQQIWTVVLFAVTYTLFLVTSFICWYHPKLILRLVSENRAKGHFAVLCVHIIVSCVNASSRFSVLFQHSKSTQKFFSLHSGNSHQIYHYF